MPNSAIITNRSAVQFKETMRVYFGLLKPRVMSLVVFTAAVALFLSPEKTSVVNAFGIVLSIALGGGGAGALNMWWEADLDAKMRRTRGRPIPAGKIMPRAAMIFGFIISVLSVLLLWAFSNVLAAAMLAFTIFFYVVIYTIWLKRRTPQNIVIGGAAGAFPPMVGWAAATGEIGMPGLSLFLLIFVWTPPHFWSLSLFMNDDYQKAGVPMLPVTHGPKSTRNHILVYTLLLALTASLPLFVGLGGPIYGVTSIAFNLALGTAAIGVWLRTQNTAVNDHFQKERAFFRLTLWYLFFHFAALVGDKILIGVFTGA